MSRVARSRDSLATALHAVALGEPSYLALARVMSASIAAGELPAGTRLPSQRRLADVAGVSRTTVVSAYNVLSSEGLVEMRRGQGTWVVRSNP